MVEMIKKEFRGVKHEPRENTRKLEGLVNAWGVAWKQIKKQYAPMVEVKIKAGTKRRSWMTKDLSRKIKERNALWKRASKPDASSEDKQEFRLKEKAVVMQSIKEKENSIRQAKEDLEGKRGTRGWWTLMDSIQGRKSACHSEPDCTPDATNQAFLQKIERIRKPLENTPTWKPVTRECKGISRFKEITPEDVRAAIKGARNTASSGVDEVPMTVLKRIGHHVAEEIAEMANAIIKEARWPEEWKCAEVKPLWKKKGNKGEPKYYRPVALLPAIARLVERIIAQELKGYLKDQGILPKFQHGFRAKHSPETAITQLISQIAKARDAHEIAIVISMDLAGAFDTIDHKLLCRKLEKICGITADALKLIESYLNGRKQRVKYMDGRKSEWKEVPWGGATRISMGATVVCNVLCGHK